MSMKLILPFLLFALPSFLQAQELQREDSIICRGQKLSGPGVLCCDTLENKTCAETAAELLSPKQIKFVETLTQTLLDLPAYKKSMPSCFGTSMAIAGQPIKNPFQYGGDTEFKKNLTISYEEIYDNRNLHAGDILLFEEQGDYFKIDDDDQGRRKFKWEYDTELAHAMYYLGNGLVIQKENAVTAVTSISTIKRSFDLYSWGVEQSQHVRTMDYAHKKTKLVLRVFRATKH